MKKLKVVKLFIVNNLKYTDINFDSLLCVVFKNLASRFFSSVDYVL